jgi:hypothetical protein
MGKPAGVIVFVTLGLAILGALAACGGDDEAPADGGAPPATTAAEAGAAETSSAPPEDSGTGSDRSWDECTKLALPAAVAQTTGTGAAAEPAGGLIDDGTYVLTSFVVHGASALTSDEMVLAYAFSGESYEAISGRARTSGGSFGTNGSSLTLVPSCACTSSPVKSCSRDDAAPAKLSFTATDTEILVFSPYANGGTSVATLTKQ